MRRIQSLFKTLLMLIPMTAVPVMAIFGIPQFFPVSASPPARMSEARSDGLPLERRVGQSDALFVRSLSTDRTPSIDLFEPYDAASPSTSSNSAGVTANASSSELARRRLPWSDPLAGSANTRTEVSLRTTSTAGASRRAAPIAAVRRHVEEVEKSVPPDGTSLFSGLASVPSRSSLPKSELPKSDELAGLAVESDRAETTSAGIVGSSDKTGQAARLVHGRLVAPSPAYVAQVETLTWQQAVDRLNQLGIRTFRLTPDSEQNGYQFVCLVTSVDDPRISRRFEAESIDPLIAVGEVLAQVENWNQYQ